MDFRKPLLFLGDTSDSTLINYYYNKHIIGDWDFETPHIKQTLEREGFMIQFQLGKQINLHIN